MVYVQEVLEAMKTCILIPAHNESKEIASIIKDVRSYGLDIIVVDDGSTDNTAHIARENGAIVLGHKKNTGKGAALAKGFSYILKHDYDAAIAMDGDGQHLSEDIPGFLSKATASKNSIFIGNRMRELKTMPWLRKMTNRTMSWVISSLAKQHIPDTQCGFRLYKREFMEKVGFSSLRFEADSEVLIRAAHRGFKIESVPVKTVYKDHKSHINPLLDTLRFIRLLFRLWTTRN